MKWTRKPKKKHGLGDRRLIVRFATWPTACNNNHTHWLGFVLLSQWRGTECWWDIECVCPETDEAIAFLNK